MSRLPPWSLNKYFSWRDLLALLGEAPAAEALPAAVCCPLCRGDMQVLPDRASLGAWFNCFACGFHGDSIMLAAAKWGVPHGDAVLRAIAEGVPIPADRSGPEALDWNLECNARHYPRAVALFGAASRAFLSHRGEKVAALREAVGFNDRAMTLDRWTRGAGRYIGAVDYDQFIQGMAAVTLAGAPDAVDGRWTPLSKLLWSEFLVLPAWDLPGRIAGFGLLGLGPNGVEFAYKTALRRRTAATKSPLIDDRPDAGLFMYPAVVPGYGGPAVFAVDDLVDAARLHVRHHREETDAALPLVAWRPGMRTQPSEVWGQFAGREVFFWAREMNSDLVHHAYKTNGRIAPFVPADERRRLLESSPASLLEWIREAAVDWREFLRRWLVDQPHDRAAALVARLRLPQHELAALGAAGEERITALAAAAAAPSPRTAKVYGRAVYERDCRWLVTIPSLRGTRLLTDFTLRLHHEIYCVESRRLYLSGVFHHRGKAYPFFVDPIEILRRTKHHWMVITLWANNIPESRRQRKTYDVLVHTARSLHPPRRLTTSMRMGWSSFTDSFVFPKYEIHANGDVEPREWFGADDPDMKAPCMRHGPWRALTAADFEATTRPGEASAVYWAVTAAVVNILLAPHTGAEVNPIGLALGATEPGLVVAERAGCLVRTAASWKGLPYSHCWPTIRDCVPRKGPVDLARRLEPFHETSFVAHTDEQIGVRALGNRWDVIVADPSLDPRAPMPEADDGIIPAYLREFALRRLHLPGSGDPIYRIVEDMADWVDRNGGLGDSVRAASRLIHRAGPANDWRLAFYLATLVAEDSAAPDAGAARLKPQEDGSALLAHATTRTLLARTNVLTAAMRDYDALFLQAGLPAEARAEGDDRYGASWRLPRAWLNALVGRFGIQW